VCCTSLLETGSDAIKKYLSRTSLETKTMFRRLTGASASAALPPLRPAAGRLCAARGAAWLAAAGVLDAAASPVGGATATTDAWREASARTARRPAAAPRAGANAAACCVPWLRGTPCAPLCCPIRHECGPFLGAALRARRSILLCMATARLRQVFFEGLDDVDPFLTASWQRDRLLSADSGGTKSKGEHLTHTHG
jgi:hypothetical protein